MYVDTDEFAGLFIGLIIVIVIASVIGIILGIVQWVGSYPLEDTVLQCEVVHLNIVENRYVVTMLCDGNGLKIYTDLDTYAKLHVGDMCEVLRTGSYVPLQGNTYNYKIMTIKEDNE